MKTSVTPGILHPCTQIKGFHASADKCMPSMTLTLSASHQAGPLCAAGIVLLKNRRLGSGSTKSRLPLDASALKRVIVLGPHANSSEMLFGNYYGNPAGHVITPFEAVKVGHAC